MGNKYFNLTNFTLALLVLFIVLLVITIFQGFDWWVEIIAIVITRLSGINFQLYNDNYTDGVQSGGKVLETKEGVTTSLACGNLMHANKKAVAANYVDATQTCTVLGSLLPLSDNINATLIVPSTASTDSAILKWLEAEETVATPGVLYCSTAFANSTNARAVCASIPECGAFTYEFTSNTRQPMGCLKLTSSTTYPSPNISTYSGPRTKSVVYNDPKSTTNAPPPYYRYGTALAAGTKTVVAAGISLSACGTMMTATDGTAVATWNAASSAAGTCTLYSDFNPANVREDYDGATKYSTLLLGAALTPATINMLSNSWTYQADTDANTTAMNSTGLDVTQRQAQLQCIQTNGCNAIVQRPSGLWYMLSSVPGTFNSTGTDLYTIPPAFTN